MPLPVTNILMRRADGTPAFRLSLIGVEPADLLTVPNELASTLAARYPDHSPSLLDITAQSEFFLRPPSGENRLTPRPVRV